MTYMLLIMEPRGQRSERAPEAGRELHKRMQRWGDELTARGLLKASDSLHTRTVRLKVRDGKPVVTDGPFIEAKEIVGGYFLLDCDTREQALGVARECPAAEWATVEVREVAPCYET